MFQFPVSADQGLAQVTRASCDQHSHARLIPPAGSNRNLIVDYGTSNFHKFRSTADVTTGIAPACSIRAQPFDWQVRREGVRQPLIGGDQFPIRLNRQSNVEAVIE